MVPPCHTNSGFTIGTHEPSFWMTVQLIFLKNSHSWG